MYRQPAPPDAAYAAPAELVYAPRARGGRGASGYAALQLFALPGVVAALLSIVIGPTAGAIGLVASVALGVWLWRRKPKRGFVLRIESGELAVFPRSGRRASLRIGLSDLADVVLDTKTIRPVMDGTSAIPAMRVIDTRVGLEVDTARLALVDAHGTSFPLDAEYLAHMEATEWFGRVRTFLRRQGWVPEGER